MVSHVMVLTVLMVRIMPRMEIVVHVHVNVHVNVHVGVHVDGVDVDGVWDSATSGIDRCRSGPGSSAAATPPEKSLPHDNKLVRWFSILSIRGGHCI